MFLTIEERITKLKPSLAMREQFNELICDITFFITKYTEIVREVERSTNSVQDKIKKYEEVKIFIYFMLFFIFILIFFTYVKLNNNFF